MISFDNSGIPKAVLPQVFPGPGGPGIPGTTGTRKTCARTAFGGPGKAHVVIFCDPYREFRTSPKRLWTPQKRWPEQLFWPAEPEIDQKLPPPPLRGGRFPTEPGFAVPIGRVLQKTHPPSDDVFPSLSGRTSHAHCQTAEIGSTSKGRKGGPNFKTVRFTPFDAPGA